MVTKTGERTAVISFLHEAFPSKAFESVRRHYNVLHTNFLRHVKPKREFQAKVASFCWIYPEKNSTIECPIYTHTSMNAPSIQIHLWMLTHMISWQQHNKVLSLCKQKSKMCSVPISISKANEIFESDILRILSKLLNYFLLQFLNYANVIVVKMYASLPPFLRSVYTFTKKLLILYLNSN